MKFRCSHCNINVTNLNESIEFYKKDLRRYELGYAEILYKIVRIKNIIFSKNTRRNIKKDFINWETAIL